MAMAKALKKLTIDNSLSNIVNVILWWIDCGHYLENLNKDTINLSLYALEISNVIVKQSALSKMNLPVQVVFGKLEYAKVMAPWTELLKWKDEDRKLTKADVVIDGLYLLVKPNNQVKYNAEKEASEAYDAKKAQLQRIESTNIAEPQVGEEKPTFAWNFISKILKNLRITVKNIHIRYEDALAPIPYAMGITLASLTVETTDANWESAVLENIETKTYKLATLEAFSIYLNCKPTLYSEMIEDPEELLELFKYDIATAEKTPENYMYILGPMAAEARVVLNLNSMADKPPFSVPILQVELIIDHLNIDITKCQYQNVIHLVEGLGVQAKGVEHRQFRPSVDSYRGHYRKWWLFAYNCIIEDIRRKRLAWDWEHILQHRQLCRAYAELYKTQYINKKLPKDQQKDLESMENKLDVLNLVMVRERIRIEVAKLKPTGWFGGWWSRGSGENQGEDSESKTMMKMIADGMTPEEKERLYKIIKIVDKSPVNYPPEYVDVLANIQLKLIEVNISNEFRKISSVIKLKLKSFKCNFKRRPLTDGVKVKLVLDNISIHGTPYDGYVPKMVSSNRTDGISFLSVLFELNPLNSHYGQRIHAKVMPLRIIFNARTINELIDTLSIPSENCAEVIPEITTETMTDLKKMTVSGLKYVIEKHVLIDLEILVSAPFIIIPQNGDYKNLENALVIHLGTISLKSKDRKLPIAKVNELYKEGIKKDDMLKILQSQIYDTFIFEASNIQIMIAEKDEDFLKYIFGTAEGSPMHLINPLTMNMMIEACLISDDPNLPILKISGEIPMIYINVIDVRILMLLSLINSVVTQLTFEEEVKTNLNSTFTSPIAKMFELAELKPNQFTKTSKAKKDFTQLTNVKFNFVLQELRIVISCQETIKATIKVVLEFQMTSVAVVLIQKTFNVDIDVHLGSIGLKHYLNTWVHMISTAQDNSESDLFHIQIMQVDSKSPEFHSKYGSCEVAIVVDIGGLRIKLVQESLLDLMQFVNNLQNKMEEELTEKEHPHVTPDTKETGTYINESAAVDASSLPYLEITDNTSLKLNADLKEIAIRIDCEDHTLSILSVGDISSKVIIKQAFTKVSAVLGHISVIDMNEETIHKNIVYIDPNEKAFVADITIFNGDVIPAAVDIDVKVKLGKIKICFINWYIMNLLAFADKFQVAEEVIVEASAMAADSAKENIQIIYEKALKLKLDVNINAPKIIVPEGSKRNCGLALDLGHIVITNKSNDLSIKNKVGHNAVIDEMLLKLENFKLDKVKIDAELNDSNNMTLLEPPIITVVLNRKLTLWYKAVPDIDADVLIKNIELNLGQSDYETIMNIVSINLSEGMKTEAHAEISQTPPKIEPEKKDNKEVTYIIDKTLDISGIYESDTHIIVRWNLVMTSLKIFLFTASKTTSTKKVKANCIPYERVGLAEVSIEGLYICGRILTNNSIVNDLLLVNIRLLDKRPGRENKINCYFSRRKADDVNPSETAPMKHMLDVSFQQNCDDMFVEIRVSRFTFILSVEYLLQIANFFDIPIEEPENNQEISHEPVKPMDSAQPDNKKEESSEAPESTKKIVLTLKIEKPYIILVENLNSLDTRALILNFKLLTKIRLYGTKVNINGTIRDIQMYTCMFEYSEREATKKMLLDPFTISINGSTLIGAGLNIEVLMTDIHVCVALYTIELIMNILNTLSGEDDKEVKIEEILEDHSDIWNLKPNSVSNFNFFKRNADNIKANKISKRNIKKNPNEVCMVNIQSIVITLEAGTGNKTMPMLVVYSHLDASVCNWSSQLTVNAVLSLQVGYYNSKLALWEPVIEPVIIPSPPVYNVQPWELSIEVDVSNTKEDTSDNEPPDLISRPSMTIDVVASQSLEITVTKTCIEVLNNLGNLFATTTSYKKLEPIKKITPFKVVNSSDINIEVWLKDSEFVPVNHVPEKVIKVHSNSELLLDLREAYPNVKLEFLSSKETSVQERYLNISIPKTNDKFKLPIAKADTRYFKLKNSWGLISSVDMFNGVTTITICSNLQIFNDFTILIEVYYTISSGDEIELISSIQPGRSIYVPLKVVHSQKSELFFAVQDYLVSCSPYIWKDLKLNEVDSRNIICCSDKDDDCEDLIVIRAISKMTQVYYENTSLRTMESITYAVHLKPAIILRNCLPVSLTICVRDIRNEINLEPGAQSVFTNLNPGTSSVVMRFTYLENEWSCLYGIPEQLKEFSVWTFNNYVGPEIISLNLGMHTRQINGTYVMMLYCPYLLINKTGLFLTYKKSKRHEKKESAGCYHKVASLLEEYDSLDIMHHPPFLKRPIMLSFNARIFFGKKKISIRLGHGEWSNQFSIDVIGSSGTIVCKNNGILHQVGVNNQLTHSGLTKKITFTPYYLIINHSQVMMECLEEGKSEEMWTKIQPKSCFGLWPNIELKELTLKFKVGGKQETTIPLTLTDSRPILLKVNNQYGGIFVDVQVSEGVVSINLSLYCKGMAPAIIVNDTNYIMNFWEKRSSTIKKLPAKQNMLFTWENPSTQRILVWEAGNKKELENDLCIDGVCDFIVQGEVVYWASFLDGMQRVLLFSSNEKIIRNVQATKELENVDMDVAISIVGIGLSLVNNWKRQEILYISVTSSGIVWEARKDESKKFRPLNAKTYHSLENAYQAYLLAICDEEEPVTSEPINVDEHTEVDFNLMIMLKPRKRKIRRKSDPGIWLHMKISEHQMQLHVKVNKFQIDNQLCDCIFPVLFALVTPVNSTSSEQQVRPFLELSIVEILITNNQVKQFKYFKVLLQEFHIKVELGLINAILEMLDTLEFVESNSGQEQQFLTDYAIVVEPLYIHISAHSLQKQKSFFDYLHLSPIKIHISFSLSASQEVDTIPSFIIVLLQGIGVTLTDLHDVVLKLDYFEREYCFLTQSQLIDEATSHYISQVIKQIHVFVFGLEVLGDPLTVMVRISKGFEKLFYEPYQGAIQGPNEFVEGLVRGVAGFFRHTVGGTAGAVSRIAGAVGTGLSALTMDEQYQRMRRAQMRKKPDTVKQGLVRGGKNLVLGVAGGVRDIFKKPIVGAKEKGIEGFFKGLGKGTVGLVTRPAAGLMDLTSTVFQSIERCSDNRKEYTNRIRAPRFVHADFHMRPYNLNLAEGNKLLCELEKGKYMDDIYSEHIVLVKRKEILLFSDNRLLYLLHNDAKRRWQVEWMYTWSELKKNAEVVAKGIQIFAETKKKTPCSSEDTGKLLLIHDAPLSHIIVAKIIEHVKIKLASS